MEQATEEHLSGFTYINLEHLLLLGMYEMTNPRIPCCGAGIFYKQFEQLSLLRHKLKCSWINKGERSTVKEDLVLSPVYLLVYPECIIMQRKGSRGAEYMVEYMSSKVGHFPLSLESMEV